MMSQIFYEIKDLLFEDVEKWFTTKEVVDGCTDGQGQSS
jgi:hypothetical protein